MTILDKKSAWAREQSAGPLAVPDLCELVDLHFATQFIAERMDEGGITIRSLKDRVRHQITEGKESGLLPHQDGRFVFGELMAWAKNKKTLARAVEELMHIGHASVAGMMPPMQLSASGTGLPPTLDACHDALTIAHRELREIRDENTALKLAVAELTPYKEQADLIRHKERVGGRKGGRPSKM